MISLATTSTNTRITPDTADAKPADQGAKAGFSTVLAQHEPQAAEAKGENAPAPALDETAAAAKAGKAALTLPVGIAMPETAKGGKSLPVELPVAAEEVDSDGKTEERELAPAPVTAETVPAIVVVPQLPIPAALVAVEAEGGEEAAAAVSRRPNIPYPMVAAKAGAAADDNTQPKTEAPAVKPSGPAVALQVAPQPSAPAAAGDSAEPQGETPAARASKPALERIAVQSAPAEAVRQPQIEAVAAPVPSTSNVSVPVHDTAQSGLRTETLQELTQIVDRLTAAREALAPAAEALAIDHAEFGELSLRFDQRRDGSLSVQLSASNPDAHRAVAQAVGAQPFHSAADDRAGGQPQPQQQTLARGGTVDREGASGNGAARHEQPAAQQQQRRAAPQPERGSGSRQRAGVFA